MRKKKCKGLIKERGDWSKKFWYGQNVYLKIFEGMRKKIGNGSSKRGGGGLSQKFCSRQNVYLTNI